MISTELQRMIVRTILAYNAENGSQGLEKGFIIKGITEAGLAPEPEACERAIDQLLGAAVLTNGYGSKVFLTGGGLILAMGIRLSPDVESALHSSFKKLEATHDTKS